MSRPLAASPYCIRQTNAEGIDRAVVETLTAVLLILVAIAIVYEIARRIGVPYPTLLVLGGLALAFVPGLPRIQLEPDLVLFVFLPPLLFAAAAESPIRDLRANLAPLLRLSIGLVLFTMVLVALVAHALVPGLSWPAAFTLGAIVGPTDALAATTVFRRLGTPRVIRTLIEGEALFNDATALVAYRAAVVAVSAGFVLSKSLAGFVIAAVGGIAIGFVVGRVSGEILRRLDDPPVEVLISVVIPFAAYLPADRLGLSGVLAAVTAGLVIGSRLGTILTPNSRILWLTTWKMIGFVLNGFVFVLIGLELPHILESLGNRPPSQLLGLAVAVSGVVVVGRIVWVFASSLLPGSPRRVIAAPRSTTGDTAHLRGQLGRASRGCFAGSGARPPGDLPGARPHPVPDLRGHPRHARRPGAHPATGPALGKLGRRRARRRRSDACPRRRLSGRPRRDPARSRGLARAPAAVRQARVGPARSDPAPRDRGSR